MSLVMKNLYSEFSSQCLNISCFNGSQLFCSGHCQHSYQHHFQQTAVFSGKALKAHCTPPAQPQRDAAKALHGPIESARRGAQQ